jgi:hypothetical protein
MNNFGFRVAKRYDANKNCPSATFIGMQSLGSCFGRVTKEKFCI